MEETEAAFINSATPAQGGTSHHGTAVKVPLAPLSVAVETVASPAAVVLAVCATDGVAVAASKDTLPSLILERNGEGNTSPPTDGDEHDGNNANPNKPDGNMEGEDGDKEKEGGCSATHTAEDETKGTTASGVHYRSEWSSPPKIALPSFQFVPPSDNTEGGRPRRATWMNSRVEHEEIPTAIVSQEGKEEEEEETDRLPLSENARPEEEMEESVLVQSLDQPDLVTRSVQKTWEAAGNGSLSGRIKTVTTSTWGDVKRVHTSYSVKQMRPPTK